MYIYTLISNALGILTLLFTYFFFDFKNKDETEITKIEPSKEQTAELRGTNKEILDQ